ncbi:MAG: tRNA (adenosine(37)-N6)-threonylcarbamoyltransferase complex transferase subunit TsaD [Clostridia bacterium]|nr:tRNA (adenosine(37)-N6)-threonylcarbamoyltransferase complex transferase subunit TsaD [Clostridia bacterium]
MFILAIESSCDETSCAVVEMERGKRRILSNTVYTQIATHALYGGVVPEIASRAHIEAVSRVAKEAVASSGVPLSKIDAVGVTYAPGLIGSLLVGVSFAKSLSFALGVPLIPVDHIKGHAAAAYFTSDELEAPFLALIVSGGHTSLYDVRTPSDFVEIGSTRDDAAGEAFDKIGRVLGLPYPGGAAMDRLAAEGFEKCPEAIRDMKFPSPAISDETLDFSFSGLKTFTLNYINSYRQKNALSDDDTLSDEFRMSVAAAFTRAITDGITSKLSEALTATGYKTLVLAGGVAANSHLRQSVAETAKRCGVRLFAPPVSLCGDNAAMIGAQSYFEYLSGTRATSYLNAFASDEGASAHKNTPQGAMDNGANN